MHPTLPYINAISTATPPHDVHPAFINWAKKRMADERESAVFARMVDRAAIDHRWSVLPPPAIDRSQTDTGGFYDSQAWPGTARRMALYADAAPALAEQAIRGLGSLDDVTHLVLASCTGFVAPGIDQLLAQRLGLDATVERTLIGFMGCYAAVAAMRTAYHIVRSQPTAVVLVVTVELSTLHLQQADDLESLLAMLLFADGAAASLVSARPVGLEISAPFSVALPDSGDLITWTVTDTGFAMGLSGMVPGRVASALADPDMHQRLWADGRTDSWAVHGGGRSILDAVERGLDLPENALDTSRAVLRDCGNMSSATLMFVLARILADDARPSAGVALAFGPGLAVEGFRYRSPG
ncbi:type III polyketide synthase [Sphingobium sp. CR2-8]|uniref:type III polyketide synthase n=1 Tax=Sphingobium sp. CR2-8 TaxID=1306534 RepID=UPI003FA3A03B